MPDRKALRKARSIVIGAIVVGLMGAVLWSKPWAAPVMEVTITVLADGEEAVEVYHSSTPLAGAAGSWPTLEPQIDLAAWEGKLVRIDVKGTVQAPGLLPIRRGHVACFAELTGPGGAHEIEFVGWDNNGSAWLHFGRLGCPTIAVDGKDNRLFVRAQEASLWHVVRVPPRAALQVALKPVPVGDVQDRKPFLPATDEERMPTGDRAGPGPNRPPDVFIYLIDAVRADHLSCYGYGRNTSPRIDAFATEATLYEQAQTAATWTRPSVATLLSSIYPFLHGAMHMKRDSLDEWVVLLPEMLQANGYQTWCVATNPPISAKFGFDQGYDGFTYGYRKPAQWVNARVEQYLAESDPEHPVFMYIHTMEPHAPYTPKAESFEVFDRGFEGRCDGSVKSLVAAGRIRPKLSSDDIEYLIDLYDAELLDADAGFAQFLEVLRAAGRFDDSLIVLLADHGEAFADHDTLEHGNTLNQEEMHVPLIIRYPGGRFAGARISQRVSLVDVVPTVLAATGIEPHMTYPLFGRDLAPPVLDSDSSPAPCIYAEVSRYDNDHVDLVGIIDSDGYKRVIDVSTVKGIRATKESIGLWDTKADATEQFDVTSAHPVRAAYDEQLIVKWLTRQQRWYEALSPEDMQPVEMSDELRKELRGLGYLE